MSAASGISVPQRLYCDILALGLSRTTVDLERSCEIEHHPELPLVPVRTISPFAAPSRQASPAKLTNRTGMPVFRLLSVEGSLSLDLSIAAFVLSVFAFAIPGFESILKVRLGVFRALEAVMVVATS